jgi:hypothetical protein
MVMAQHGKNTNNDRRAAGDIMHSLRELAEAVEDGVALNGRFTVRTVSIPEPENPKGR